MSQRRIPTVLVLLLCGLSIALMAPSRTARQGRQVELVIGNRNRIIYDLAGIVGHILGVGAP